jgi:RES domain-containing protein
MQAMSPRPRLDSFRMLAFQGNNQGEAQESPQMLEMQQDIQLGLAIPNIAEAGLQVSVRIRLDARSRVEQDSTQAAFFSGEYEAKFHYAPEVQESTVTALLAQDDYQYLLVAQAYPLAMTSFRRELQAMGLDARNLPLGLG